MLGPAVHEDRVGSRCQLPLDRRVGQLAELRDFHAERPAMRAVDDPRLAAVRREKGADDGARERRMQVHDVRH